MICTTTTAASDAESHAFMPHRATSHGLMMVRGSVRVRYTSAINSRRSSTPSPPSPSSPAAYIHPRPHHTARPQAPAPSDLTHPQPPPTGSRRTQCCLPTQRCRAELTKYQARSSPCTLCRTVCGMCSGFNRLDGRLSDCHQRPSRCEPLLEQNSDGREGAE
jgi:hypothetical protein